MAIKSICDMHFGVQVVSRQLHFILVLSGGTKSFFTLPPGTYYWDHPEARKNIVDALNTTFRGYLIWSKLTKNQLGVRHAGTDYAFFLNIENSNDYVKLARLMGLYDNSGSMEYYGTLGIPLGTLSSTADYVFQPTMNSFFSQSGRLHESPSLKGITKYEQNEIQITQDGKSAVKSYNSANEIQNWTLTYLTGDDLKIDNNTHGTQDVMGTSVSDWSCPFWVAYSPEYNTSSFYSIFYDKDYKKIEGEWHITDPISHENAVQSINRYAGLYNIAFNATFHDINTDLQKYLYFSPLKNPTSIVVSSDLLNATGDMFLIFNFRINSHDTSHAFIIGGWRPSPNNVQWALRFSGSTNDLYWWQGTLASYQATSIGATLSLGTDYRMVLKRKGAIGTNNLTLNFNGVDYTISTTKTPGVDGILSFFDFGTNSSYTTHGYVKNCYFANNYYPTDAEWEAAKDGDYGDPRKYTVAYHGLDYSGTTLIDHSGNDLHMTLANCTREYLP